MKTVENTEYYILLLKLDKGNKINYNSLKVKEPLLVSLGRHLLWIKGLHIKTHILPHS